MAGQPLLTQLPDDALACVLCCVAATSSSGGEGAQHLLRLSRCSRRLHAAMQGDVADDAWRACFSQAFGPGSSTSSTASPAEAFKQRWIRDSKEARLQRRVQRMRLESDAAHLFRELQQLQRSLTQERRQQAHLQEQLSRAQVALRARSAVDGMQWQLGAVRLHNQSLAQAAPVSGAAHMAALQQQVRVSQLELRTMRKQLDSQTQRLAATRRRLAALEG